MFSLMIALFVAGYLLIVMEHPLKIDKTALALITGVACWVVYMLGADSILALGYSPEWANFIRLYPAMPHQVALHSFVVDHELTRHLGDIAEILFFLLAAMTIVEVIDQHQGFKVITDKITTTHKVKLLWIIGFLAFFLSAVLDNLTTTIVLVALLRKLISEKQLRWTFVGVVVLAANAGGAWSPIGDVTTIMLWIGGQVTTLKIIQGVLVPSLVCMIVPLIVLSFTMKGDVVRPKNSTEKEISSSSERMAVLILGGVGLLSVPVFKSLTHLPPYLGMLLSLGVIWLISDVVYRNRPEDFRNKHKVATLLQRVDVPTVLFFLGILSAVSALQSAGHLNLLAQYLDEKLHNVYLITLFIGLLSSIIDNVPLVAGAIGMYPIADPSSIGYVANFVQDGAFWEFLSYTAGTGGSILIIGSAAGIAAMGMEKIDFLWYLKHISWLAFIGYLSGALVYVLS